MKNFWGRGLRAWGLVGLFLGMAVAIGLGSVYGATEVISLDGTWQMRIDAENAGKDAAWFARPLAESGELAEIPVPGVIQQVYPDYHGLAWFERTFVTPQNPNASGRAFLRFWQAEYRADVWVNGRYAGFHEGGEGAFNLDVTDLLATIGAENRLTVRVLNAADEPIDGISLTNVPSRNNTNKPTPGCGYASGGLVDSVELLLTPPVHLTALHLLPDWKTGEIRVEAFVENAGNAAVQARLALQAASADGGFTAPETVSTPVEIAPGASVVTSSVTVPDFKLWELNDPNLYTVAARLTSENSSDDFLTAACGFRDFRFENGAFRLNGKRIYVKCSHSGSDSPITIRLPFDPDLYRRDILLSKTMGLNMIRYIAGMPRRFQLDLCDRLGLLVYDECLAGWCFKPCPERPKRYAEQTREMIRRDWNHPSVVIWGLLNETFDVDLLLQAADFLPEVRRLDPDRMIFFNSGSFDPFAGVETKKADYSDWRRKWTVFPAVVKNETGNDFEQFGTLWKAGRLALHPGDLGKEYAAMKWTAPAAGRYRVDLQFYETKPQAPATVDLHLFQGEKEIWTGQLNLDGCANESAFADELSFAAGEELTLAVGVGNGSGADDAAFVDLTITAPDGQIFRAADDWTPDNNPNGVWTYGWLPAGEKPILAGWTPFDCGEKSLACAPIGRFANPGVSQWQNVLGDTHPYQQVPHTAAIIRELRDHAVGDLPIFLSEYGIGSGVDLFRITRLYEEHGGTQAADARDYQSRFDRFMADWERWRLDEIFTAGPEDYFRQTLARMAEQRRLGINAIRSNPNVVAHSVTGTHDQGMSGEGLTTLWREMKPGTVEAMADVFAPLRFCNFVEPVQAFSGDNVRFEAVLVNEDVLPPGDYPVRYRVMGPNQTVVFDETRTLTIPTPQEGGENPMVLPALDITIPVNGPTGEYSFRADFQERAAACGGWEHFFVTDRADMPSVSGQFLVWGDENLLGLLQRWGIDAVLTDGKEISKWTPESKIIIGRNAGPQTPEENARLTEAVARGASVLYLAAGTIAAGPDKMLIWPGDQKIYVGNLPTWLYHKDDWTKKSAPFDGLPAGDVSDTLFYREVIPTAALSGDVNPDEIFAGAFNTQMDYSAGLSMALWKIGQGRVILNTWRIEENLPNHPVAERMLRNLLNRMNNK